MIALWRIYIYHRMGGHETDIGFVIASDDNMDWRKSVLGSVGADIEKRAERIDQLIQEKK